MVEKILQVLAAIASTDLKWIVLLLFLMLATVAAFAFVEEEDNEEA